MNAGPAVACCRPQNAKQAWAEVVTTAGLRLREPGLEEATDGHTRDSLDIEHNIESNIPAKIATEETHHIKHHHISQ